VVRQLLAAGLLAVEGEYGTLVLTERSADVLRGDVKVMMRREVAQPKAARLPRARTATAATAADLTPEQTPVFERLRAWRAATAKEQSVPAYVIFHDATLRAIAALAPSTLDQLGTVSGVGQAKLVKFGSQVLDVLAGADPAATSGGAAGPAAATGSAGAAGSAGATRPAGAAGATRYAGSAGATEPVGAAAAGRASGRGGAAGRRTAGPGPGGRGGSAAGRGGSGGRSGPAAGAGTATAAFDDDPAPFPDEEPPYDDEPYFD